MRSRCTVEGMTDVEIRIGLVAAQVVTVLGRDAAGRRQVISRMSVRVIQLDIEAMEIGSA